MTDQVESVSPSTNTAAEYTFRALHRLAAYEETEIRVQDRCDWCLDTQPGGTRMFILNQSYICRSCFVTISSLKVGNVYL